MVQGWLRTQPHAPAQGGVQELNTDLCYSILSTLYTALPKLLSPAPLRSHRLMRTRGFQVDLTCERVSFVLAAIVD